MRSRLFPLLILTVALNAPDVGGAVPPEVTREVRAILAKRCLNCHGPDAGKREADLRLDQKEGLLNPEIVVPGKSAESELIKRILSKDPDEVMPPPDKGDPVTPSELKTLQAWVDGGAPFAEHWAFVPPVTPVIPAPATGDSAPQSKIDAFVFDMLAKKGMAPAEAVSKETWLRRASFDLTGLPPTLEQQDAFLADASPKAYEHAVDQLLNSQAYGERMALDWLDVARYADTYGRHEDAYCLTWPYRDWVIKAFNQNLPYDQFITWQTAGDMLPNPTQDMMVATCFNRLPQQSNEAGSNAEEFRIEQVADRVRTTSTAFLGLTMECARCHDHKYDPLSMKDYYSMASYFTNIDELGLFAVYTGAIPPPSILMYEPEQEARLKVVKEQITKLEKQAQELVPGARKRFEAWLKTKHPPQRPEKGLWNSFTQLFDGDVPFAKETRPLVYLDFESIEEKAFINKVTGSRSATIRAHSRPEEGKFGNAVHLKGDNTVVVKDVPEMRRSQPLSMSIWLKPEQKMDRAVIASRSRSGIDSASKGFELILEKGRPSFALVHFSPGNEIRIHAKKELPINAWTHLAATYDGSSRAAGLALYMNGERMEAEVVRDNLYRDIVYRAEWGDEVGKDSVELNFALAGRYNDSSYTNGWLDEFAFYDCELTVPEVRQLANIPDTSKPEDWFAWYVRERDPQSLAVRKKLNHAREEENRLSGHATELMVMKEWHGPRKPTHILNRGQYNEPKEEVLPQTPASLFAIPADFPPTRLGLAQWMTDRRNPLTARVAVNRFWQQFFGRGLVLTAEDFGTQGQYPTHPELLDWLALHFMDSGWDVKALCKTIVLSSTYRQSATPRNQAWLKDDPDNRWLSRGPRYRLGAEQVRDMALATSGLLVPKIGGMSTRPYQPEGLWEDSGTQHTYTQDHGQNLYRRSMYTLWRRTLPPPTMSIFDAPTREFCKVRRDRTATPLQALVLMNDPQFIEAGRVLGTSLVKKHPQSPEARVIDAFRLLTSQRPTPQQVETMTSYLKGELERFAQSPKEAEELIKANGEFPIDKSVPVHEIAATTLMVRLLHSFSETTMKP